MNCKPGDLAIVVKSIAGNEGKIVRVLRLHPNPPFNFFDGPRWFIDRVLLDNAGDPIDHLADVVLRPIRGTELQDETLTWAGKPKEVIHELSTTR